MADRPPLVERPPAPTCRVCVVIPVRDESERLAATLRALARQVDRFGRSLPRGMYELIVLANNCRDDTAMIARTFAARHADVALHVVERSLPPEESNVGHARALLMDEAHRRLAGLGHARGVIATTDGDTTVAPGWIASVLADLARGVGAVGGRILIDPAERAALDPLTRAYHLRDVGYHHLSAELECRLDPSSADPWPRHHQHFGASLAITTAAYRRVGGLPRVPALEDVALYRALVRADVPVRHSPLVRAWTSARRLGRAQIGLSSQLSEWETMAHRGQPHLVEPAATIAGRADVRRRLRELWRCVQTGRSVHRDALQRLGDEVGVATDWLAAGLDAGHAFGLLFDQLEERGAWPERGPLVPVGEAIEHLRSRLDALRRDGAGAARRRAPNLPASPVHSEIASAPSHSFAEVTSVLRQGIAEVVSASRLTVADVLESAQARSA